MNEIMEIHIHRTISCLIMAVLFLLWDYSSGKIYGIFSTACFIGAIAQYLMMYMFHLAAEGPRVRLFSATDFMLFDSNDLLYFEILQPKNISYIYKVKPAKNFGTKFVSNSIIDVNEPFLNYKILITSWVSPNADAVILFITFPRESELVFTCATGLIRNVTS